MKNLSRREALDSMFRLAGVTALAGTGCAVNPVTGKRQLMLMSENKEIQMGMQAHDDIVKSYGSYPDDSMQSWFDERGQEMAAVTHRTNLNYHFTVLDSPVINAFAVPGGYVYVTRGILANFNNEAQFAGVLGHELGHVNARHTASRYSKAQLANIGLGIGTIFSEEFAKYAQIASLGTTLLFLKFSRNDERQADKLGVEYSSAVDYDAVQISEFFHTLERMHPKGGGSLPAWQSTHPDPGDRINATRKQALTIQQQNPGTKYVVRRDEYFDLIDGIIYGDDPRQGYEKDGVFYHPGMKFSFPVPAGWQLSNQPSEVRMSPEKQNSILIFTVAPGTNPRDAATAFATENSVTVSSTRNISIHGMPAAQSSGNIASGEQTLAITSYFIKKDDSVFAFHGLSNTADAGSFTSIYSETATGFNYITDSSFIDVEPKKLVVRATKGTRSFRGALNEFGIPEDKHEEFAILNGMEMDDSLPAGTRIKIVS